MHGIGGHFAVIEIEDFRQHFVGKARREPVHALIDTGEVTVFLIALGLRIGVLEIFTVVDAQLRFKRGILRLFQARQHGEARHHFQGAGSAGGIGEGAVGEQLFVDMHFFRDAQAIGHLDDIDAIEKSFVIAIVAKRLPF